MQRIDELRADRLYTRAILILDGLANGHGEPILWHLARRGYTHAMVALAGGLQPSGKIADGWSAAGLEYRAWRLGYALAANNLAVGCFNRRDLQGYRRWLRRAADAGDAEAAASLRCFETRLPHRVAREIRRGRPSLPRDGWWTQRRLDRRRAAMLGR